MYLDNGIKIASKEAMKTFMLAILADNDKQQRENGFNEWDIIEIFEQSEEVGTLNETQKKAHGKMFSEIVAKLKKKVLKLNKKYRPSETAILELVPKLTAVILEIFSEEPFQRQAKFTFE